MDLSTEQKTELKLWLDTGMTLTEIYKKVTDHWKLPITYMELRFLIDDLDLNFSEPKKVVVTEEGTTKMPELPEEPKLMHSVNVTVDKVVRPGALASGSVTFGNGSTAAWQLDQMGRIGLIPGKEGYKPSKEEIEEFQIALEEAMHKSGF